MFLETDQIACYDMDGRLIACRDTGQDASFKQPHKTVYADRFSVQEDQVEDSLTGLHWKKHAGLSEFPLSWTEAHQFVKQLACTPAKGEGGGWRLPSRRELFSLVSHQHINPALPLHHPFTQVFTGYYWTGTTCSRLPDQAWYVHLGGGRVYRGMKHGSYMVWPVRGKMQDSSNHYDRLPGKESVYHDSLNARWWYVGSALIEASCDWKAALGAIARLNAAGFIGYKDWRLPTIRELESLVDDSRHSPALVEDIALGAAPIAGLWSSTTSTYEPRYAWVLYIQDGALGVGFKAKADFHVIAVRGCRVGS